MSHQERHSPSPELLSNANHSATEFEPRAGVRAEASQALPSMLNQASVRLDADHQSTSAAQIPHQGDALDKDLSTVDANDMTAQLALAHAEPDDNMPPVTTASAHNAIPNSTVNPTANPTTNPSTNPVQGIITATASQSVKPQERHPMNSSAKPDNTPQSPAWQAELMNCCQQLAQCAVQELTLPVSAQKLYQDVTYRQQVSVELLPLKHPTLTALIHRMNALSAPLLTPEASLEGAKHSTDTAAHSVTPAADMTHAALSPQAAPSSFSNSAVSNRAALNHESSPSAPAIPAAAISATATPTTSTSKRPAFILGVAAVLAVALGIGGYHGGFFASDSRPSSAMTGGANPTALSDMGASQTAAPPLAQQPIAFRLHGSNTIGETLAPALLEAFLRQQKATHLEWVSGNNAQERQLQFRLPDGRYRIELAAHGSGTAFAGLLQGSADIGMSSRPIHAEELDQLQAVAGDMSKIGNEHIIALDGLAIIVNQNNPVEQLSTAQLAQIFAGTLRNWQQLGGPNQPIRVMARDEQSGTFDTFSQLVLKKHSATLDKAAQRFESSRELSNAVSQHEGAIGFIGLNYVQHNKALAIYDAYAASANSEDGAVASTTAVQATTAVPAIVPTRFTIGTEDYALTRRLFLYTPTQASQLVKDFAAFAISDAGQTIVAQHGLVALKIESSKVQAPAQAPALYRQYAQSAQRLSINFRFKQGDEELDNKGKRDLERLVRYLEAHPEQQLVLMGFSDSVGDDTTNLALSRKRVAAVAAALQRRGVPIAAEEAFGELLPVASNHSTAGQQRNRRVEVWLQ